MQSSCASGALTVGSSLAEDFFLQPWMLPFRYWLPVSLTVMDSHWDVFRMSVRWRHSSTPVSWFSQLPVKHKVDNSPLWALAPTPFFFLLPQWYLCLCPHWPCSNHCPLRSLKGHLSPFCSERSLPGCHQALLLLLWFKWPSRETYMTTLLSTLDLLPHTQVRVTCCLFPIMIPFMACPQHLEPCLTQTDSGEMYFPRSEFKKRGEQ